MSEFVKGKCPLCGSGIFVAAGNWLTCSGSTCPDPTFVSEIFANVSELNAQLAQREGEIEALRGRVKDMEKAQLGILESRRKLNSRFDIFKNQVSRIVFSSESSRTKITMLTALFDNPESPALTDKEEGE